MYTHLHNKILEKIKSGDLTELEHGIDTHNSLEMIKSICHEDIGYGCKAFSTWAIYRNYHYYYYDDKNGINSRHHEGYDKEFII